MTPTRRSFLKQLCYGTAGVGLLSILPGCQNPGRWLGGESLPRSTPEAQGIASAGILAFLKALRENSHELHSFMMLRHGQVIAEGWWTPYGPTLNHWMYSVSKSFTSTAIGLAAAEGRLTVEDRVLSFFPKQRPAVVSDNLAALRVKDLLTMSVGNEKEPTWAMVEQEDWVSTFLSLPIITPPGRVFQYNSGATYMLSAILHQVCGERLIDFLTPRLFDPLGIEGATWERCPRGIDTGGWGLSLPTEAMAKFGQLYLQKGLWHGRQVLPAKWVEEATSAQIMQTVPAKPGRWPKEKNDWLQGYGYQFWRCRYNAFRADGAFGQFIIVLPELDVVIAMTSENKNMQSELDKVWDYLLPAIKPKPLPADETAQSQLRKTLAGLALIPSQGRPESTTASSVSGKSFKLGTNELGLQSVSFEFRPDGATASFQDSRTTYSIPCGFGRWQRGATALPGTPPRFIRGGIPKPGTPTKVAASGSWKDDRTFEMIWRYYETPHHDIVSCRFDGTQVSIRFQASIIPAHAKAKSVRPVLQGQLAG